MNEGIVKFSCEWQKAEPLDPAIIDELNRWRQVMYNCGLIGVDAEGVGFGNISQRLGNDEFVITGSGTGLIKMLTNEHYTVVEKSDVCRNRVFAHGSIIASSESMTHAVLYSCDSKINAVVHVHSKLLWERFVDELPTSSSLAAYGTPQMAAEMARLYQNSELPYAKILVMAGHKDGLMAFGETLEEACGMVLSLLNG